VSAILQAGRSSWIEGCALPFIYSTNKNDSCLYYYLCKKSSDTFASQDCLGARCPPESIFPTRQPHDLLEWSVEPGGHRVQNSPWPRIINRNADRMDHAWRFETASSCAQLTSTVRHRAPDRRQSQIGCSLATRLAQPLNPLFTKQFA